MTILYCVTIQNKGCQFLKNPLLIELVNQQSGPSEMCLIEGLGLFNFVKEELKDESFHVRFLVTI